jgi:RNA polymerase sigma-70 factor (ECF subfamily)
VDRDAVPPPISTDDRFAGAWRAERRDLLSLASRMLNDQAEAQDIVQEAFSRLATVDLDTIDDARGWLIVVVRRLCLDRIRSARSRRESVTGTALGDDGRPALGGAAVDPADRVTLDDQVRMALAVVLDRLTPAERTAFVLHDVFGYPFDAVGEIVGRTPAACRQLASRARRSIEGDAPATAPLHRITRQQEVAERFIAACSGGDITELMTLLDPDVDGEATMLGRGPLVQLAGRDVVAQRILGLFGPGNDIVLRPVAVEDQPGVIAFSRERVMAVVRLDQDGGLIRHIHTFVLSRSDARLNRP